MNCQQNDCKISKGKYPFQSYKTPINPHSTNGVKRKLCSTLSNVIVIVIKFVGYVKTRLRLKYSGQCLRFLSENDHLLLSKKPQKYNFHK